MYGFGDCLLRAIIEDYPTSDGWGMGGGAGGGNTRILVTEVCGWEVDPPPFPPIHITAKTTNIPIHIIWSKIITYSYNLYPNPYLFTYTMQMAGK